MSHLTITERQDGVELTVCEMSTVHF